MIQDDVNNAEYHYSWISIFTSTILSLLEMSFQVKMLTYSALYLRQVVSTDAVLGSACNPFETALVLMSYLDPFRYYCPI